MKIGEVKQAIEVLCSELERVGWMAESRQLGTQLTDLCDDVSDDDIANPALGVQVKRIVLAFWQQASQRPVTKDWETNASVCAWLKFKTRLQDAGWALDDAHHGYFYHCLEFEYNHAGKGLLSAEKLLPVLLSCCRMIGYAEKKELHDYPFNQVLHIGGVSHAHLIESVKAIVTSLAVIFYVLYHLCSPMQRLLLPRLITYRLRTTDEERRSETALVSALYNKTEQSLNLLMRLELYIDSRELFVNESLKNLAGLIPNSRRVLIEATIHKRWYYEIAHSIYSEHPNDLVDSVIRVLARNFDAQGDRSFQATLSFAAKVNQQLAMLERPMRERALSALYFFCLGQYIELRAREPILSSFFSFSRVTKCSAAKKIQQQERGYPVRLTLRELGATKEGRLSTLVNLFEGYKHERLPVLQCSTGLTTNSR